MLEANLLAGVEDALVALQIPEAADTLVVDLRAFTPPTEKSRLSTGKYRYRIRYSKQIGIHFRSRTYNAGVTQKI